MFKIVLVINLMPLERICAVIWYVQDAFEFLVAWFSLSIGKGRLQLPTTKLACQMKNSVTVY